MAQTEDNPARGPLSLQRLSAAFAQMLGPSAQPPTDPQPLRDPCEIGPLSIVEAILFVGGDRGARFTAGELAARMRDVSAEEVRGAIEQLNSQYEADGSPYFISGSASGYKMTIREEMSRVRDKFYGRVKESRLSPRALEVLSVIAYRQPTTADAIDKLRGARSAALVAQLVRRGLVRRDPPAEPEGKPTYRTTDRFLHFFRLENVDQLPRAAELDD